MSDQRDKARRLSEYVDSLLLPQRYDRRGSEFPPEDRECRELRSLAQSLADVSIEPPQDFARDLAGRLPRLAEEASFRGRLRSVWGRLRRWMPVVRSLTPAFSAVATVLALALVLRTVVEVPVVSASEILTRSDEALVHLVKPGQILYRRWRVTSTTIETNGDERPGRTQTIREWMDGADYDRVAGRWSSADDRLLIGYTSRGADGAKRPHVYFSPGVFSEPRGLFSIEPTAAEFQTAAAEFAEPVRSQLSVYLRRQPIYLPIVGERTFNRAVIDAARQADTDPARVVLSFDLTTIDRTPVYRVRVKDPASIEFNWRSERSPRVRLVSAERVRYIARDSYLSVRTEDSLMFEDGRQRFTTRELVETRAIPAANLSLDPFVLEIPEGTPAQHQSAREHLSAVAQAFGRLPAFTRLLGPTTTSR